MPGAPSAGAFSSSPRTTTSVPASERLAPPSPDATPKSQTTTAAQRQIRTTAMATALAPGGQPPRHRLFYLYLYLWNGTRRYSITAQT